MTKYFGNYHYQRYSLENIMRRFYNKMVNYSFKNKGMNVFVLKQQYKLVLS